MAFAEKLKAARTQAGLSQVKLAAELNVTNRTIISYESGQSLPSSDKLSAIAKYFGVTIESLISETEEFVAAAYEQGGRKGAKEAQALVDEISGLFAGGSLSEDDKDAVMRAIQNAYWKAKEESKRKFTPKKHRAAATNE